MLDEKSKHNFQYFKMFNLSDKQTILEQFWLFFFLWPNNLYYKTIYRLMLRWEHLLCHITFTWIIIINQQLFVLILWFHLNHKQLLNKYLWMKHEEKKFNDFMCFYLWLERDNRMDSTNGAYYWKKKLCHSHLFFHKGNGESQAARHDFSNHINNKGKIVFFTRQLFELWEGMGGLKNHFFLILYLRNCIWMKMFKKKEWIWIWI